ncbi:MAG: hypothetical protein IKL24_02335 [Clostridia bacterium]|nr:hypothetical protein [Clostridia bacterium]
MKLISIPSEELRLSESELALRLKVPRGCNIKETDLVKEKLLSLMDCKAVACVLPLSLTDDGVVLGDIPLKSHDLKRSLLGKREALVLAVTLGMGVERYLLSLPKIGVAQHFIADSVASAYAEALCDKVQSTVLGNRKAPRFSPGYGDLSLEAQRPLLALLAAERTVGITLNESLLMRPQKSITAIVGI